MEEHKPNHKPVAQIPEALHPEIGNGSALEADKHAFTLRTPDPSVLLTEYLSLPIEEISESESPIELPEETQVVKEVKKKKAGKPGKEPKTGETAGEASELAEGKSQKAGKLLRKAAKTVKKQEEGQKAASGEITTRQEVTLSPFTSWLKNLAGSDYVHPYEDDFAFEQAKGPSQEGISETFADLLASQGYKDRAREMYINLMEKYPEKSGFFAAKIEALQ
jgi:hypothetical protein